MFGIHCDLSRGQTLETAPWDSGYLRAIVPIACYCSLKALVTTPPLFWPLHSCSGNGKAPGGAGCRRQCFTPRSKLVWMGGWAKPWLSHISPGCTKPPTRIAHPPPGARQLPKAPPAAQWAPPTYPQTHTCLIALVFSTCNPFKARMKLFIVVMNIFFFVFCSKAHTRFCVAFLFCKIKAQTNNSCKLDDFDLRRQISGFSSFYCFLPTKLPSWSRPRSAVGPLFHYLASWLAGSSHSTKPMRLVGHSVWYQIITVGFDVMASLALTQYIGEELTAPKLVRPNTYSTFFSALRVYWKPSIFFVCLLR